MPPDIPGIPPNTKLLGAYATPDLAEPILLQSIDWIMAELVKRISNLTQIRARAVIFTHMANKCE
jgi:hypothetical protein